MYLIIILRLWGKAVIQKNLHKPKKLVFRKRLSNYLSIQEKKLKAVNHLQKKMKMIMRKISLL